MRKKRVVVVERNGVLVLVRDKRKELPDATWGWSRTLTTPNTVIGAEGGKIEDQSDNPHSAGSVVVRRDSKGWYIRISPCEDPYGQEDGDSGTRCNRQKPHVKGVMVEETISPESDEETVFWCPWCHEEDGLNQ